VKAVVASRPGGPDVLELREVEAPSPGLGEVAIDVLGAGVNRADLLQRRGHYPPPPGASDIIGLEVSGRVGELGAEVAGWAVGDPCVALLVGGGYAERVVVPAGQVLPPPPGLDLLAAAGVIEVAATVVSNLQLGRLRSGEVFLVHGGAGGIGSFAIQYAKALGATVITTAGSADKLTYCRLLGADHAISYRDDWPAAVRAATEGGVDVVLDNMGAKYLDHHLDLLAPNGRLVIIGFQGGTTATLDLRRLLAKGTSIAAASLRARPASEKSAICAQVAAEVWPLLGDGTIRPTEHRVYPLAEAAEAHARLESGDHTGKIILQIASS